MSKTKILIIPPFISPIKNNPVLTVFPVSIKSKSFFHLFRPELVESCFLIPSHTACQVHPVGSSSSTATTESESPLRTFYLDCFFHTASLWSFHSIAAKAPVKMKIKGLPSGGSMVKNLPGQSVRHQVQSLIWEDPTCQVTAKSVCPDYWTSALEPMSCNHWTHVPQLPKPTCLEPMLCNKRNHCNETPTFNPTGKGPYAGTEDPAQP